MIYKKVFDLRGTEEQQRIVREALDAIKFPFERIKFPRGTAVIGWTNLNSISLQTNDPNPDVALIPNKLPETTARYHEGVDHGITTDTKEPLVGEINGRKYTMGVFYPSTGNIYVDTGLVAYPHLARTTISAEVAHSVDEFLPMSESQRNQIKLLVHGGTIPVGHNCRWWEQFDYNKEYWDLVGETFMPLFTYAYSDLPFDGVGSFSHKVTSAMAPGVRNVLGIQRTDITETVTTVPVSPISSPSYPAPNSLTIVPSPYKPTSALVVSWTRSTISNSAVELWMNNELLATLPGYITSYTLTGLTPGTNYNIKLRNKWSATLFSEFGNEKIGTTQSISKPVVTTPVPVVEPISTPIVEPTPAPLAPIPTPVVEPTPSAPEPTPVSTPIVEPVTEPVVYDYVVYGSSKVYHDPKHYKTKAGAKRVISLTGLTACKVCVKSTKLRP